MRHICRAVVSDTKRKGDKGVVGGLAIRGVVTSVWQTNGDCCNRASWLGLEVANQQSFLG